MYLRTISFSFNRLPPNGFAIVPPKLSSRWIHSGQMMTSNEVANALRPFIFSVHPDRFWKHPKERSTNEVSLKKLNEYLGDKLNQKAFRNEETITFYVRHNKPSQNMTEMKKVDIMLSSRENINVTVHRILLQCSLPTDYLLKIGKQPINDAVKTRLQPDQSDMNRKHNEYFYSKDLFDEFEDELANYKMETTMFDWLKTNYAVALNKLKASQPIQDELLRLKEQLIQELNLVDLCWNCDWSVSHIRGCLKNLSILSKQYPNDLTRLNSKTVVFTRHNGVGLKGQVILSIEDVRDSWLDLIRSIKTYDSYLLNLPAAENDLSDLLGGITIVQPQYNLWNAKKYFQQLQRLIKSVKEYKSNQSFPSNWPESLSQYRLIVEMESGPLMLSPTGDFIAPASCPVTLLVRFINENMSKAGEILKNEQCYSIKEQNVRDQCVQTFGLKCLDKDENITSEQMVHFISRLLKKKELFRPYLHGTHVRVSMYYSVLNDGQICVPFNFTA